MLPPVGYRFCEIKRILRIGFSHGDVKFVCPIFLPGVRKMCAVSGMAECTCSEHSSPWKSDSPDAKGA